MANINRVIMELESAHSSLMDALDRLDEFLEEQNEELGRSSSFGSSEGSRVAEAIDDASTTIIRAQQFARSL